MYNKDKTGQRIGILTLIERQRYAPEGCKQKQTFYLCICDCGTTLVVSDSNLMSSMKKNKNLERSCGCLQREWVRDRSIKEDGVAAKTQIFNQYKGNAKQRNIPFMVTKEELLAIVFKDCYYCSMPASTPTCNARIPLLYSGIDRIDNTKGYTLDNIVPCCKWCNIAKIDRSLEYFLGKVEAIVKNER